MGLYIVKQILNTIDAEITIENKAKGMEATLTFKRHTLNTLIDMEKKTECKGIIIPEKKGEKKDITLLKEIRKKDRKNVFLIDNNVEHIASIQKAMYDDFNVFTASNGEEATEKIKNIPLPDVIILDVLMEPISGIELYTIILNEKQYQDIPVIFISARDNKEDKLKCLSKGAIDYLIKPFDNQELILKVQYIPHISKRKNCCTMYFRRS